MLIKKKSLIVALVSSFVIALVLVLTLVGYVMYIELKGEEAHRVYQGLLQKVNAKAYSKYIEISNLDAKVETSGPLKEKSIIAGIIKNRGNREIASLLVKVTFLDQDSAILYDVVFHPQEPSLGSAGLTQIAIPYLAVPPKIALKPGGELPFKKILVNCPDEIISELKNIRVAKGPGKWSGKIRSEILSVDFP